MSNLHLISHTENVHELIHIIFKFNALSIVPLQSSETPPDRELIRTLEKLAVRGLLPPNLQNSLFGWKFRMKLMTRSLIMTNSLVVFTKWSVTTPMPPGGTLDKDLLIVNEGENRQQVPSDQLKVEHRKQW
ncbi:hypothetical protein FRX31_030070 [Thalictrum thalictroides]|uniref:Uncharacterized protein n=1 Tax=Thalictrum thalictroides TaxID=46969 RepID=A0A7J6V7F9_THATH|nr:hypothetical protein FRX31_030070 [Thalictrum thalictroides]